MRRLRQPQPHRQAPAGAGADRHQQVHVAGAGLQRMPAGAVEARAQPELHRRGQQELQPGRQHPVHAEAARPASAAPAAATGPGRRHRREAGPGRRIGRSLRFSARAARSRRCARRRGCASIAASSTARTPRAPISVARFTLASVTPGTFFSARSTRARRRTRRSCRRRRGPGRACAGKGRVMDRRPCHDGKVKPRSTHMVARSSGRSLDLTMVARFTADSSSHLHPKEAHHEPDIPGARHDLRPLRRRRPERGASPSTPGEVKVDLPTARSRCSRTGPRRDIVAAIEEEGYKVAA
jgi:hypothetical protein